jgi:hypothetical protein
MLTNLANYLLNVLSMAKIMHGLRPETDHICPDPSSTSQVFLLGLFLTLTMTDQQSQLNQQMQLDKLD